MNRELSVSPDAWMARNLNCPQAARVAAMHNTQYSNFRLRALPAVLLIASLVVVVMWYQEGRLGLLTAVDRIAYPIMLTTTLLCSVLLKLRPEWLRQVVGVAFAVYTLHILGVYYEEVHHRINGDLINHYDLMVIIVWLPLGYVSGFVFFSPQRALWVALAFYAAVALPQLAVLFISTDSIERQIAIAILLAQPLYIAALWGVVLLKRDASGSHEMATSMNRLANVDALTGVANRYAMTRVLEAVARSEHTTRQPVAMVIFDVDHFKRINDTHGHMVGDMVLLRLASEARKHQRSSDLLARWGGEEFMILAYNETPEQAVQMAERLRRELEAISHPQVGRVTVSMGVTTLRLNEDMDRLIHRADLALYQAKSCGRNRVVAVFNENVAMTVVDGEMVPLDSVS